MNVVTEAEVVRACQKLFGNDVDISRQFLYYSIQPSGVRSAYRKKAKENHPDLFAADPVHIQQKQTALFREIIRAYDTLNLFFKQREEGVWRAGRLAATHRTTPHPKPEKKASPPRSSSRTAGDDIYYRGPMPRRRLQFGQFLYYRGKITFGMLIRALVWQRRQRPTIGEIAVQWGMLGDEDVNRIFGVCGRPRLFGEKAVELGLLSVFQVNTLLLYQRSLQNRLGAYFADKHILTRPEIEELAQDLKEHNARILAASLRSRPACA